MEFQQVSQNGIVPQTPLRTRQSLLGLMVSTTSTYYGEPVILRAVSDASINKFEPAYFYNYTTNGSSGTFTLLGTSTWIANNATLVTTGLITGTNNVYCVWPGEGPFAPQSTWPNVGTINVAEGEILDGVMTLTGYPSSGNVVVGEGPVTFAVNFTSVLSLSGNVQFYANNILLGVAPITNNQAFFNTSDLPAGINVIKAVLPSFSLGAVTYRATSQTLNYEILRGTTITTPMTVSFSPGKIISYEGDIFVRATITGTNNLPGTVNFFRGIQFIGSGNFVGDTAEVEIFNNLPPGTETFTASWDGNQDGTPKYIEKTSTATVTILERNTLDSFVLTASTYEDVFDTNYPQLFATANTSSQVTGIVNFIESGVLIGQAPFVNNTATFTATNLTTGTYFITAQYPGSEVAPKFFSTISNVITFTVAANYTTTISISGTPNPVYQLNTGSFTVTATDPFSNTYSGIVTVSDISYVDNVITTSTFAPDPQVVFYDIENIAFVGTETLVQFVTTQGLVAGRDLRFMYPDLGTAPWLISYAGPRETGIYKIVSLSTVSNNVLLHGPNYNSADSLYNVMEYWDSLYPSGISTATYQNTIYPGFEITPGLGGTTTATVRTILSTEVLGTGTWRTSDTFNLTFDPNLVEPDGEYSHFIQATWPGQPAIGSQLPYAPASSNLLTQNVTPAMLTQTLSTGTITVADFVTVNNSVNTNTVAKSYTMSVLRNNVTVTNTATVNNSATVRIAPGVFTSGTYAINSVWNNTNPRVISNTSTLVVNERADYPGTLTITGPSNLYQLDNNRITATLSVNTATSGTLTLNYYRFFNTVTSITTTSTSNIASTITNNNVLLRIDGTTSTVGISVNTVTNTQTLVNTTVTTSATIISSPSNIVITTATSTLQVETNTATTTILSTNYNTTLTSTSRVISINQSPAPFDNGQVILDNPVPIPSEWRDPAYFRGYVRIDGKRAIITSYDTSTFVINYAGFLGDYPFIQGNRYTVYFDPYYERDITTSSRITTSTQVSVVTNVSTQSYEIVTAITSTNFVNTTTATVSFSVRDAGTSTIQLLGVWSGQTWNPARSIYPYNPVNSNLLIQTINPGQLTLTATTANNYFSANTVVATLNTSSVNTTTLVTFYNNNVAFTSTNIVGNTATIRINTGTFTTSSNIISARILNTDPVISSNTASIYSGLFPEGYVATTTNQLLFDAGIRDASGRYFYDEISKTNRLSPIFTTGTPLVLPTGYTGGFSMGRPGAGTIRMAINDVWTWNGSGPALGTGDYTVEFRALVNVIPVWAATGLWFSYGELNVDFDRDTPTGITYISLNNSRTNVTVSRTNYHIAFARYNGILTGYINGQSIFSTSSTFNMSLSSPQFNGSQIQVWDKVYIDNFRISAGARYNGNFNSIGV